MVQSSYYFWAALRLQPKMEADVSFVVPTGAFGNAISGYLAKRMGLHIGRIVCATNANDVVHRAISTGQIERGPNLETISPAMDIQVRTKNRYA
jgi:threonine synthase